MDNTKGLINRFDRQIKAAARSWPIGRRFLIACVVGQFTIFVATIAFLYKFGSSQMAETVVIALTSFAALMVLATILFSWAYSREFAKRLTNLKESVRGQVTHSELHISLETDSRDELWELVVEINELLSAYQIALVDLAKRTDRFSLLNAAAAAINRSYDLKELSTLLVEDVIKGINWGMGAVYLWNSNSKILELVCSSGIDEKLIRRSEELKLGDGLAGQAAKTQQIIITEDIREHPAYSYLEPGPGIPITQVSIPMVAESGELLGVFQVGNSEKTFPTEDDLNLLATISNQLAVAIVKLNLYEQVSLHAEQLEQQVELRTRELAEAIDELSVALEKAKEADKVKTLLLSTVSHELRTPLATIKGNTSLILEHLEKLQPAQLREHLTDIEEETDKLTELINNLLEMNRIEAGILHIRRDPVNLVDVMSSVISAARVRMSDREINFDSPRHLPIAYADPRRIEQIVANLLDNAAKYSAKGTPIDVILREVDNTLTVSVRDYGQGIPAAHIDHIFERFYQIPRSTSNPSADSVRKGIGLGLAICRGLVEAHQGKIWVESQVDEGSTFTFSLPIATPDVLAKGD